MTSPQFSIEFRARSQWLAALIERVAGGDQDALTALYDATNKSVYGLLLRMLSDAATAEEVLLDVYIQVWRQAARYDAGRGSPQTWLIMMARSRAIDRLRAGRMEAQDKEQFDVTHDLAMPAVAEEAAAAAEMQRLVQAALETLAPEQREVIELAYYSGLSHSEIAAKLDQPLGTVKTRTRRGMIKLREILAPVLEVIR